MLRTLTLTCLSIFFAVDIAAQCVENPPGSNRWVDLAGGPCNNAIPTAVPFLRITPEARAGAMGDAGIAVSPDANSIYLNTAKLAFAEEDFALAATYTPWLRNLGLQDVYLAYLAGFRRLDDLQSLAFGLRFFSLGEIQFTDINGQPMGIGRPHELEAAIGYARKLGERFSVGLNGKLIYSNLQVGQPIGGLDILPAIAGAADISLYYEIPKETSTMTVGLALSNIGSKISYTRQTSDFLPVNFGIGAAWTFELDQYNTLTLATDINKLMVPTPQHNSSDYRFKSLFAGMMGSFSDAPGGLQEELQELTYSIGAEYWYDKQFAVRAGYFRESPQKGNRNYITMGLGVKYNVFGINLSYLISVNNTIAQGNPLDKTLRFSLLFDFGAMREGTTP